METPAVGQMTAWAARFAVADAASAARLRLEAGVRAAVVADQFWLRGERWNSAIERLLDIAAPDAVYRIGSDQRLTPIGRLLSTDDLPAVEWKPLAEVLSISMTPALAPGAMPPRVSLRLVRSSTEQPAAALLTDFDRFTEWCDTAPAVRFGPLRFARRQGEALILGHPLPPLAAVPLYESAGIVVPCGFTFSPAVDAPSLRALLRLDANDLALFDENGWCRLAADAVVPVTRSGVRLAQLEASA